MSILKIKTKEEIIDVPTFGSYDEIDIQDRIMKSFSYYISLQNKTSEILTNLEEIDSFIYKIFEQVHEDNTNKDQKEYFKNVKKEIIKNLKIIDSSLKEIENSYYLKLK